MRTQTPRTRSAADAGRRSTSVVARLLLVAMLMSITTAAQAARTEKAAATQATKTTKKTKANKTSEAPPAPVATTVYRCRQADGQLLYTQQACPATAADKVMQISDARTQAQARHSESMQSRNRKLSQRMQRERESWARQAMRHNKQALALTLPALEDEGKAEDKAAKRKSASRSSKQASRKARPDKTDARDQQPLRPADFTARVPGSKASTAQQHQGEDASVRASPKS